MSHQGQFPVPEMALADPYAVEVLSVWSVGGELSVGVGQVVNNPPETWGVMLAQLPVYVAKTYEAHLGLSFEEAYKRVMDGFNSAGQHVDELAANLKATGGEG